MAQSLEDFKREVEAHLSSMLGVEEHGETHALTAAVVANVHWADERPQMFSIQVLHDGITTIRYDLRAALEAVAGVAAGVLGSPSKSEGAALAIACLLALHGVRNTVADDLGAAILALHERGGTASVDQIHGDLNPTRLSKDQVHDVLRELRGMGAVRLDDEVVRLEEKVLVRYRALPSIAPR